MLLAGTTHLSKIARWLTDDTQQDSRIQWIRRLLEANYMRQEYVYYPLIQHALSQYKANRLHLIMDRSPLPDHGTHQGCDLLSVSLNFRKRAIPLVWEFMPHGMSGYDRQTRLIERCRPLLPGGIPVGNCSPCRESLPFPPDAKASD